MRNRLIELLKNNPTLDGMDGTSEDFAVCADYLIKNGVIAPPLKIGASVFYIKRKKIHSVIVDGICVTRGGNTTLAVYSTKWWRVFILDLNKCYFSYDDAKKALADGRKV